MNTIKTIKLNGKKYVFVCRQYNDTFKSNDVMNGEKCIVHECDLQIGSDIIGVGKSIFFEEPCESFEYKRVMFNAVENYYSKYYFPLLKEFLKGRKHTRELESKFYNTTWKDTEYSKEFEEFKKYFGIR